MFHFANPDVEVAARLLIAAFLGGLIGMERESHGKDAGFRTYSLVALGSALIMIVSFELYLLYKIPSTDPSRIAAQAVSGIGFIGAGAIIRSPGGGSEGVRGLTTAAGIWTACGIGLACGMGLYYPAVISTVLTLIILLFFSRVKRFISGKKES